MTDRIIDIADEPARLSVCNSLLVIRRESGVETTLPLADLAVLVASHPQITFTQAVLAGIAAAGGAFISCDRAHMPAAMLLPLTGHHIQGERFARQAQAPAPLRKQLWKQIVRAKLRAQARLLKELRGDDQGLAEMISHVRSGDSTQLEAQASRRYWPALFADPDYRRGDEEDPRNSRLNYGYAVLRAVVARALCAAGLHPSLALHHHNRYDAFRLADDLMEPLRPVVDGVVARMEGPSDPAAPLDRQAKADLLQALMGRFIVEGESRTLFDIAARTAASLAAAFAGERDDLILPET
ncbi:MAG: type II CRISPR-associated endonuclease Cas1 [Planctomycetota bacterium]